MRGWMGVQIQPVSEDLANTYGLKEAQGRLRQRGHAGLPRGEGGPAAGGRDPLGRRAARSRTTATSRATSPRRAPGATVKLEVLRGRDEEGVLRDPRHLPGRDRGEPTTEDGGRAKLGMTLRDLTPAMAERLELPAARRGSVVMDVEAGEAAEDAGLSRGDVIVSVNGDGGRERRRLRPGDRGGARRRRGPPARLQRAGRWLPVRRPEAEVMDERGGTSPEREGSHGTQDRADRSRAVPGAAGDARGPPARDPREAALPAREHPRGHAGRRATPRSRASTTSCRRSTSPSCR